MYVHLQIRLDLARQMFSTREKNHEFPRSNATFSSPAQSLSPCLATRQAEMHKYPPNREGRKIPGDSIFLQTILNSRTVRENYHVAPNVQGISILASNSCFVEKIVYTQLYLIMATKEGV